MVAFSLCFIACSESRKPISLNFSASWDGHSISCQGGPVALNDLRFYVSDIVVINGDGSESSMILRPDSKWQSKEVGLIDLEDGSGNCANGSREINTSVSGTISSSEAKGLRFSIGVPFDANHSDPMLARPPLDNSAMHWHWRSGYKFFRGGVATLDDGFYLHLGSTGCEGTIHNITGCSFPNRVAVEIDNIVSSEVNLELDLAVLFRSTDLNDGQPSDCSSGPGDADCEGPFTALGLAVGKDGATSIQRVVRVLQ